MTVDYDALVSDIAVCRHPSNNSFILVKRGSVGYWPAGMIQTAEEADLFNAKRFISPAQREAMQAGSMFGWDVPGADPAKAEKLYKNAKPLAHE